MSAPIRLAGKAWANREMDVAEKAEHLRNAPLRADDMMASNRRYFRLACAVALSASTGLVAASAALGTAIYTWKPAEPVAFANILPDGRIEPMMRGVEGTQKFTEATAKQYLRMYLDVCEPYHPETAKAATARCALLLTSEQQSQYKTWFEENLRNEYGRTGSVSVADNPTYFLIAVQGRAQIWGIRFTRVEMKNRQLTCRSWLSTVTFSWRPDLRMTEEDRTWNLAGMQISDRQSSPDPSSPSPTRCF